MKKHLPTLFKYLSLLSPRFAAKLALELFATPERIGRPESEMLNFQKSKKFKLSNGIQAFQWGNKNNPIVLLIHGWNGRGTQMAFCQEELVSKGFQVIALDGPAHGDSPGKKTNPVEYAKFILDAQRELAPEGLASIVAHSFGGGCASYSVELGLKTKSVVLIASPDQYKLVVDDYLNLLQFTDKAKAIFLQDIEKITGLKPDSISTSKYLKSANLPLLIVHDKKDNAVPYERGVQINQAVNGSKLLSTDNLGHRRVLKSDVVIKEIANFIYSHN